MGDEKKNISQKKWNAVKKSKVKSPTKNDKSTTSSSVDESNQTNIQTFDGMFAKSTLQRREDRRVEPVFVDAIVTDMEQMPKVVETEWQSDCIDSTSAESRAKNFGSPIVDRKLGEDDDREIGGDKDINQGSKIEERLKMQSQDGQCEKSLNQNDLSPKIGSKQTTAYGRDIKRPETLDDSYTVQSLDNVSNLCTEQSLSTDNLEKASVSNESLKNLASVPTKPKGTSMQKFDYELTKSIVQRREDAIIESVLGDTIVIEMEQKPQVAETECPSNCISSESTESNLENVGLPTDDRELEENDNIGKRRDKYINQSSKNKRRLKMESKYKQCEESVNKNDLSPKKDCKQNSNAGAGIHVSRTCVGQSNSENENILQESSCNTYTGTTAFQKDIQWHDRYNLRSNKNSSAKKKEWPSTVQKSQTEVPLTKNIKKGELLDCIVVKFHTVVSAEVRRLMGKSKAQLYIVFGSPVSDWKSYTVQLEIRNNSHFANSKRIGYATGELQLSKKNIRKNIPYKYLLFYKKNIFESLVAYNNSDLNRVLTIRSDLEYFNKYDEALIFNPEDKGVISIPDVVLVFASTLDSQYIQKEGISAALRAKETIFNAFEKGGNYLFAYSTKDYNETFYLQTYDLERRIFYQIYTEFEHHLDMTEISKNRFMTVAYLLIYIESSSIKMDSLDIIKLIFITLSKLVRQVIKKNIFKEVLPTLNLRLKMKNALVNTANTFFYLIDCLNVLPSKEQLTDCCAWIVILPYIEILDEEIHSNKDMLKGIHIKQWKKQATKHKFQLIRYLQHSNMKTSSHLVKESIISAVAENEMIELFRSPDHQWIIDLPFYPIALAFFELLSKKTFNDQFFTLGSSQLLVRLRILLTGAKSENSKTENLTGRHILHLLDVFKGNYTKHLVIINLLLQMLEAYNEADPEAVEETEIETCGEILITKSYDYLVDEPVHGQWKYWVDLYAYAKKFQLTHVVERLFNERLGLSTLNDCIDIYFAWEDEICHQMLDIVVNKTIELLHNDISKGRDSYFAKFYSTMRRFLLSPKSMKFFSRFLSRTFYNGVTTKSIMALCRRPDVKIFSIMLEMEKDLPEGFESTLNLISNNLYTLKQDLDRGNVSVLDFQEVFGFEINNLLLKNINELHYSVGKLLKNNSIQIDNRKLEYYHQKVQEFTKTSKIFLDLIPSIKSEHMAFIKEEDIPEIPNSSEVMLHQLNNGLALFQISDEELNTLKWFGERHCHSRIFPKLWKDAMQQEVNGIDEIFEEDDDKDVEEDEMESDTDADDQENNQRMLPLDWQSYKSCLLTSRTRIQNLLVNFNDKTISIGTLESLIEDVKDGELESEFQILGIASLIPQAHFLLQMRNVEAAVMAFENMLKVLGRPSFKDVDLIKERFGDENFRDKKVTEILNSTINQGKLFETFQPEDVQLLESFGKCGNLVHWIQEHIKSNQEFKVFLDLASISAGESDIDLERLMIFRASVTGFAPLFFDINKKSTLDEVMDAITTVLKNRIANSQLPANIIETNRLLPWIKDIQERHGSVEASSLTTVEHINSSGCFTIRCKGDGGNRLREPLEAITMNLEMSGDIRVMEHSELDELRSKLMLITVKEEGELAVDCYTRVLDYVEIIAKKLSNLLDAGCHLFSELKIDGYFNVNEKVTLRVDFGHKSGIVNCNMSLIEGLQQIIGFLQKAGDNWDKEINELRETYSSLNYFTTEQLVLLSAAFAQLIHSMQQPTELSLEAAMLIKSMCPSISLHSVKDHVIEAYNQSINIILKDESHIAPVPKSNVAYMVQTGNKTDFTIHPKFNQLKTESAAEQNVVIACLAYFVDTDVNTDDLVNWCIDHEDDSEADLKAIVDKAIVQLKSRDKQNCDFEESEIPACADTQMMKFGTERHTNRVISKLEECLYETWSSFQYQNNDELKAKDYIPFNILASCIENVVALYSTIPQRTFPKYLTKGRPNLLICPQKDIHKIALMIFQADEKKPSPTLPEVLICSKKTTKEQVDLLCRRAFKDDSGKIFVVLHAHLLSFEIVTHAENLFTMQSSSNYKIVFLSSAEGNRQPYINTAFEDSLVTAPPPPMDSVLDVFLKHYQEIKAREIVDKEHPDPDGFPVRVVTSEEYGNGKSLLIKEVSHNADRTVHLHLDEEEVDVSDIIDCWSKDWSWSQCHTGYSLFHLDATLTTEIQRNDLLFSLAVLGGLANESPKLWVLSNSEVVMAELTSASIGKNSHCPFYKLLPSIRCKSPQDVVRILEDVSVGNPVKLNSVLNIVKTNNDLIYLMNEKVYLSDVIQRPYQYLALSSDSQKLDGFTFAGPKPLENVLDCLKCLLNSCPIKVPTWVELIHFSSFLNIQLKSTEKSVFCDASVLEDSLHGFKSFVVQFLIQMAQDFATRSVRVSDESHGEGFMVPIMEERRQWEHSPHPYIFFNKDTTLSFFGFFIDRHLNLVDEKTNRIIKPTFITGRLYQDLRTQGVVFNKHFANQTRIEKLARLCTVIGAPVTDPDPRYELTYDNVMKILATIMRFRSNIPVVMMGETGSGKTTLVRFLCALHRGLSDAQNMIVMKIHGGVTKEMICCQVNRAIDIAKRNITEGVTQTVLFFDEANTTSAISTIKTVMCDRLVDGQPIPNDIGLQFVAAVNPYRKHSDDMIRKLEDAGLGYHIQADQTADKLGSIPMRRLVYRVREIPQSMFPLIWDFGTLDAFTERLYIQQMVEKWMPQNCDDLQNDHEKVLHIIVEVLCFSQEYMRQQKDECFFVSLRDVDRTLKVLSWFCRKNEDILDKFMFNRSEQAKLSGIPGIALNMVLAIGVTYYVRLQDRLSFATKVGNLFQQNRFNINAILFSDLIEKCQDLFLDELQLESNIAPNTALKENVWMMTLCIELQIPLFLVGKPGSSKSLAKTVVSDVMQGEQSYSQFFKNLKEIQMISFQCSPIATANGILGTFKQSQKFQKERDLSKFGAVVVLDEIGLAEDSEKMPLKALHPLLEDGCIDEEPEDYMKVAFIGISNWALDPAKMNRGIFVSRGVPSRKDLEDSAEGICKNDSNAYKQMRQTIKILTEGYFALYKKQEREYFGLRDFYSLIKNVFNVAKQGRTPSDSEIIKAVQRNFGGFFGDFDPVDYFLKQVDICVNDKLRIHSDKLIFEALKGKSTDQSRYILLLTRNNAALHILQEKENLLDHSKTHVMFGSSFPQDKEYTSICYNINKVKIAMELGHTVILCNLNNLYESLYDALNQNYVLLGGKRYVDLGLGTHRVKCRVHEEFRLILIADDEEVHKKFPIPLINRLEKHYLSMETIVDSEMEHLVKNLEEWVNRFCKVTPQKRGVNFQPGDVFIGYHGDIISAIILRLQEEGVQSQEELKENAKKILLACAAPDGIMRLSESTLQPEDRAEASEIYYLEQHHTSLGDFLRHCPKEKRLIQVTTSSRLLTSTGRLELEKHLGMSPGSTSLLTLQQFESRLAFEKRLKDFITDGQHLLIIQSDVSCSESIKLIECARFVAQGMVTKKGINTAARIVFVIHVQRIAGGIFPGMSVYPWLSFHIDELRDKRQHDINIEGINQAMSLAYALEQKLVSIEDLVIDTVPKAASLLRINPSRVQRRIDVLLEVLKSNDSELLQIVCKSITKQLRFSKLKNLKKLLLSIAMDSTHMKEGNTFQRSVWLHLQEEIVAPLRMCIETLDMDEGLELLLDSDKFVVELYLQWFSSLECTQSNLAETWYQGAFPFSRVICDELEQLYKVAGTSCLQLHCAFQDSRISEPLLHCFTECERAVPRFVLDLLQLNFNTSAISVQAKNMLCEEIYFIAESIYQRRLKQNEKEDMNDDEAQWRVLSPVDIFFAIKILKPRLVFLQKLLMFDNRLCDVAAQMIDKRRTLVFRTDILLFQKLLVFNAAKPKELSRQEDIDKWCLQISKLVSLYNALISLDTKDELMPELRTLLDQLAIIKLFLHHTGKSKFRPTEPILKRLVRRLDNNTLKKKEDFDKFVKVLLLANKESIEFHFASAGNDKCILCEEGFDRPGVEPVELPCRKKHMGCKKCLEEHFKKKKGEWTCPSKGCGEEIPKTFDFKSTLNCQKKIASHQQYKNQLQFFFLDVLQLYVFANEPPHPDVTDQVMSYVVTTKLDETKTKTISPFADHGIDATPVIRSFLLQLLLKGNNFSSATTALKRFLSQRDDWKLDQIQFRELCLLSVYCLEDRLMQEQALNCRGGATVLSMDCCMQLLLKHGKTGSIDDKDDLEFLLDVANMRLCILSLAPILHNIVTIGNNEGKKEQLILMDVASRVICGDSNELQENMKCFLVRVLVNLFSRGFIKEWQQSKIYLELMPCAIRKLAVINPTDNFFICSDYYGKVRQHLRAALLGNYGELNEIITNAKNVKTEWNLALYFLRHIEGIKIADVRVFVEEVKKLDQELAENATTMLQSDDRYWLEFKPRTETQIRLVSFLHYLEIGLGALSRPNYLQDALKSITCQTFYPTMKQDDSVEIIAALKADSNTSRDVTMVYRCPNCQTPFVVGDCGRPVAAQGGQGKCPQCNTTVGGASYNRFLGTGKSSEQTGEAKLVDGTQPGHILGTIDGFEKAEAERDLCGKDVAVVQFFVHAAMTLHLPHQNVLLKCIHPPPQQPLSTFLMNHLENNFEQICQALGKSNDDVMILLFHVAKRLCDLCPNLSHPHANLQTKKSRQIWENEFARQVIHPEVQNLERNIELSFIRMAKERTEADEALEVIISSSNENDIGTKNESLRHTSQFWFNRTQLNVSSLQHTVIHLNAKCPNLFRLLADKKILSELNTLPLLLQMQFKLCKLFNKRIESHMVADVSVEDFLVESFPLQSDHALILDLVKSYFATFNKLKHHIFASGQIGKSVKNYLKGENLNLKSAAGVLFASEHPAGQCFNSLVDCLVIKHNFLMDAYFTDVEEEQYIPEPSCLSGDMSPNQLVTYNEKDLNLMLVMHSDYALQIGGERGIKWKLNEEALEQNVVKRFFAGRAKFRMDTLPKLQFRNDDISLVPLREKIQQEAINLKVKGHIRKELVELRDVGNVLDCLQTTLTILQQTVESKPEDYLTTKMKQLHLYPEHGGTALRGLKLKHIDACFAFLTLLRARWMLKHKHNPFDLVESDYHRELPCNINKSLKQLVDHQQIDQILFQLHLFIHKRLKKTSAGIKENIGMDSPEGILVDYFGAFLDGEDDENAYEHAALFDRKLQNCHAVEVFIELLERHMPMN